MDVIKARNCNHVYDSLYGLSSTSGDTVDHLQIGHRSTVGQIRNKLPRLIESDLSDTVLIIDISSIPRSLLWSLLSILSGSRTMARGMSQPLKTLLVYSWAEEYPDLMNIEKVGRILGSTANEPIPELVHNFDSVAGVVCAAGNTQDAFRTVFGLADIEGKDVSIDAIHFIRSRGFAVSYDHLVRHQRLLDFKPAVHKVRNKYAFDADHVLNYFREAAVSSFAKLREGRRHKLIIAPYGPKVFATMAQFVATEYKESIRDDPDLRLVTGSLDDAVEVLGTKRTQYLSVYSMGSSGDLTTMELQQPFPDELAS